MVVKLNSIRADLDKETEGDWIKITDPDWEGVELQVRSLNYQPYAAGRDKLLRRWGKAFQGEPVAPNVRSAEFGKLYARFILLGWRGFDEEYSSELALERLSDPAYRELVQKVEWAASKVGEAEVEQTTETAKN